MQRYEHGNAQAVLLDLMHWIANCNILECKKRKKVIFLWKCVMSDQSDLGSVLCHLHLLALFTSIVQFSSEVKFLCLF